MSRYSCKGPASLKADISLLRWCSMGQIRRSNLWGQSIDAAKTSFAVASQLFFRVSAQCHFLSTQPAELLSKQSAYA